MKSPDKLQSPLDDSGNGNSTQVRDSAEKNVNDGEIRVTLCLDLRKKEPESWYSTEMFPLNVCHCFGDYGFLLNIPLSCNQLKNQIKFSVTVSTPIKYLIGSLEGFECALKHHWIGYWKRTLEVADACPI
jgi:hypothetical protein